MNKKLSDIGRIYGTDKSGVTGVHIFNGRCFLDNYERHVQHNRMNNLNILEMGVLNGGSLNTWSEYFPNSNIVAIDIDPSRIKHQTDRIKIYTGSQADHVLRDKIISDYSDGFDIIIDDASHINELTIESFDLYFKYLKRGGLYIIEDTHCTYGYDIYPNFEDDVKQWPGMELNNTINFSNNRRQFDDFLLPKIKNLDTRVGDIFSFHIYSETIIIEKNK